MRCCGTASSEYFVGRTTTSVGAFDSLLRTPFAERARPEVVLRVEFPGGERPPHERPERTASE